MSNPYRGPFEDLEGFWIDYGTDIAIEVHWRMQLNRNVFAKKLIPIAVQANGDWAFVSIPAPLPVE